MDHDEKVIDDLANVLERLWGGGGEYGVYVIAMERHKLRPALKEYMNRCRQPAP